MYKNVWMKRIVGGGGGRGEGGRGRERKREIDMEENNCSVADEILFLFL